MKPMERRLAMKCNRTVCNNKGLHTHKHNGKKYCSECVFLIEENITLFGDPPCFDITRDQARAMRIDDELEGD